jgi:hypothetical protein
MADIVADHPIRAVDHRVGVDPIPAVVDMAVAVVVPTPAADRVADNPVEEGVAVVAVPMPVVDRAEVAAVPAAPTNPACCHSFGKMQRRGIPENHTYRNDTFVA